MKTRPTCLPCVLQQTLRVAREATSDDWSQRKVLTDVMRGLMTTDWNRSPADVLGEAIDRARQTLKVQDPFAAHRQEVQKDFEALARDFRARLASAPDRLDLAVRAATAANIVDALIFGKVDYAHEFDALVETGFALGKTAQLRESLESAQRVLYLLDNAGEVYFDALLIEEIRRLGKRVRAVASGGGLLHDVTAEEAVSAGLGRFVEVEVPLDAAAEAAAAAATPDPDTMPDLIETPYGVLGTPLPPTSKWLKEAIADADLVIAKGSANYETFVAKAAKVATVIYLLRVKCEPVAESIGVPVGSLVLLKQAGQPKTGVVKRVDLEKSDEG